MKGRAYRLTGETRFAQAVAEQIDSWLEQNPFGIGMNWRSGLELAIRLISWVWALDLIEGSGVVDQRLRHRILDSAARHIWEIDRKYSRGSSVNNHLIGEAAGVFVAADGSEVSWTALNMHDDTFIHVRQFQFLQETPGRAVLRVVPADGFGEDDADRIHRNLGRKLDGRFTFTIELVEAIPLSARGKAIYVDQRIPRKQRQKNRKT